VRLVVNDTIVKELISHLRMIIKKYEAHYKENEAFYLRMRSKHFI
jgi:hypothetical protein